MNRRGFSITELMVALCTLAIVLAGVYALQRQGLSSYLMGAGRVEAQSNARAALDLMVHELRYATAMTAVTGCDAGTSDITFSSLDDQNPTGLPVSLRYRLNGTNLERTKAGTTTVLIGGVQNLTFTCYDGINGRGSPTATPGSVRLVVVTLTVQPENAGASYSTRRQQVVVQSEARLRNVP
jgi:type II secretory pathway component PulJ